MKMKGIAEEKQEKACKGQQKISKRGCDHKFIVLYCTYTWILALFLEGKKPGFQERFDEGGR